MEGTGAIAGPSTSARGRRRRSSAHSAASSSYADQPEYSYALPDADISEWLKCPICLNPFVDPTLNPRCEHVFCRSCLDEHVDTLHNARSARDGTEANAAGDDQNVRIGQCPTCRASFDASTLKPAAALIRNMVDSLLVRCAHEHRGCTHTCERSLLDTHVHRECQWAYVGEYGSGAERQDRRRSGSRSSGRCECGKRVLRKDWRHHVSTADECTIVRLPCPYGAVVQDDGGAGCVEYVKEADLANHVAQCPSRPTECEHCQESLCIGQLERHLQRCPELEVACPMEQYGCRWRGRRAELEQAHEADCKIAPLKPIFESQSRMMSAVQRDNERMAVRMHTMERQISTLTSLVKQCAVALGTSFVGAGAASEAGDDIGGLSSTVARRREVVVPISSPQPHTRASPPNALQGRSGSTDALRSLASQSTSDAEHTVLSTSAPATAHELSRRHEESDGFPWPVAADRHPERDVRQMALRGAGEEEQRAGPPPSGRTVSEALAQLHGLLETANDQQTRMQRRLDDSYALSLNAGFEAGRAHEELNSLRHGMHSVRLQMHSLLMQQQQHMMPVRGAGAMSATSPASAGANPDPGHFQSPNAGQPPFAGPTPPPLGLRRFWTGFEQTRL